LKTKAVRIYGSNDLRLEEFDLPAIKEDEILASVKTDSICMSTWKLLQQGANHTKAPDDLENNPIIIGHEFCGDIIEVGAKWKRQFFPGEKYIVQANLQLPERPDCPGYSYPFVGGDATYVVLPNDIMQQDCLISYKGDTYFEGSIVEPLSTVIGAFNANYHLIEGTYNHEMGIKEAGNLIILGGTGPMGYLAVDYALNGPKKPETLVITGRTQEKLDRMAALYPVEEANKKGVTLYYVNTGETSEPKELLNSLVAQKAYDDVFVFTPSRELVELGSALLARDGCLNFFAGPKDTDFEATINFYDIHYRFTHFVGTSGANSNDMREAVQLIEEKKIDVSKVITHVLGLNDAAETTRNLPDIGGGKKLVYTQKHLKRFSLEKGQETHDDDTFMEELHSILRTSEYRWSKEAEQYVLEHANEI